MELLRVPLRSQGVLWSWEEPLWTPLGLVRKGLQPRCSLRTSLNPVLRALFTNWPTGTVHLPPPSRLGPRCERQAGEAGSTLRGLCVLRDWVAPPRDSSSGRAVGARCAEPRRIHAAEGGVLCFRDRPAGSWGETGGVDGPDGPRRGWGVCSGKARGRPSRPPASRNAVFAPFSATKHGVPPLPPPLPPRGSRPVTVQFSGSVMSNSL